MGARHTGVDDACGKAEAAVTEVGALMARALLVMSRVACLDDEDMGAGGGVEEAWAMSRVQIESILAFPFVLVVPWLAASLESDCEKGTTDER
uniref:Uncharacterized protein n=1 Tax=Oryza punctata TaxID=4537 RepID=A0A0E0LKG3_ORYPU